MNKKTTLIQSLTLFVTLFGALNFGFGQTTLVKGDIAIIGVNTDSDDFTFLLRTDITVGTTIYFSDNEVNIAGNGLLDTNEGIQLFTAATDYSCGTVIGFISNQTEFSAVSGTFILANGGDEILAFQGYNATTKEWTTFLHANVDLTLANLPIGFAAVDVVDGGFDNREYNGSTASPSWTDLNSIANYDEAGIYSSVTLSTTAFSCSPCPTTTTWNGSNWSSGLPNISKNTVINGIYDTSINGSFSACSLIVNTGFSLTITNGNYVEIKNDVTVDGGIIVNPQGTFVQINDLGTVNVSGTIQVEKQTSPLNVWYEYTYWCSPVSGETIGNALFFSDAGRRFQFNGQNYLDAYEETNNNNDGTTLGNDGIDDNGNDWQWVSDTTPMITGVGYASTHSQDFFFGPGPFATPPYQFTYIFTGPFNNGVINVPIYRNDSELNDENWNFIGNPYPSAIDADIFLASNTNISKDVISPKSIDGAIFLWSQNTDASPTENGNEVLNFSTSDYAIINGIGENSGGDGVTPNRFIPSGQGFFVSMSDAAPSTVFSGDIKTSDVIFNNSMRVKGATDNSQFFKGVNTKYKSSTVNIDKLWINLTSDNGVFNQTLIGYANGATNNDDGMYYDAVKNLSAGAAAIVYSIIEGSEKVFAIQGKSPNSLTEDEVIRLGFNTTIDVPTTYTLSVAQLQGDFLSNNTVYLKDQFTNTLHDLSANEYHFTSAVGEFKDRFEIVFNAKALSAQEFDLEANAVVISQVDQTHIKFKASKHLNIKTVSIYDLLGRQLYQLKGNQNEETYHLPQLNPSVFIAKVLLSNGALMTKKAIKK